MGIFIMLQIIFVIHDFLYSDITYVQNLHDKLCCDDGSFRMKIHALGCFDVMNVCYMFSCYKLFLREMFKDQVNILPS